MDRAHSFGTKKLSLLDRVIFEIRKRQFHKVLVGGIDCAVELGSGFRARLLQDLLRDGSIARAHAVDLSIDTQIINEKLTADEIDLNTGRTSLSDSSVDLVISLALLEHLSNPGHLVAEAHRILRPEHTFVLTTPSPLAKPVLELMAYYLHIIDEDEIRDHKHYFTKGEIHTLFTKAGFRDVKVKRFLFGLNTIATGVK